MKAYFNSNPHKVIFIGFAILWILIAIANWPFIHH